MCELSVMVVDKPSIRAERRPDGTWETLVRKLLSLPGDKALRVEREAIGNDRSFRSVMSMAAGRAGAKISVCKGDNCYYLVRR